MLQLIEISLICTGIHVCFWDGMVFGDRAKATVDSFVKIAIIPQVWTVWILSLTCGLKIEIKKFHDSAFQWIIKPLYECLPCMASVWTIVLTQSFNLKDILIVCGMNAIIASVLQFLENVKLPENEL